jgi:hypothetical protein
MNNRALPIVAALALVVCAGAVYFLTKSPPPRTAASTPAVRETPAPQPGAPVEVWSQREIVPAPAGEGEAPASQEPQPAPATAQWEVKIDQILRLDANETETAQLLLNVLPTLPPEGQADAAQHITNLISDEEYGRVLPLVRSPSLNSELLEVLVNDLMNREEKIMLPTLLDIAKTPSHPHHEAALSDLQVFLEEDFGTDWAKWDAAMKAYFAKQQPEAAAETSETALPAVPPPVQR